MSVKGFTFKLATKGPWSSVIKDQVRAHSKYNLAKTSGHYLAEPAHRADTMVSAVDAELQNHYYLMTPCMILLCIS